MRGRIGGVVLTLLCLAGVAGTAVVTTATAFPVLPAVTLQQAGHWVLNKAAGTVFHVHGGTQQVDAQVAVPQEAAQAGTTAVQGDRTGYVVGSGQAWPFDKATLSVDAPVPLPTSVDAPVAIEVVGGPYLVYRSLGTIVRLGRPPVVVDAGGPVGMPVRTTDGTVWVHRPDTGVLCALRRDEIELDCSLDVGGGAPGGLTVTADRATFVDVAVDAARQVRGTALAAGAALGSDLLPDVLLADQDTSARLPVVVPGVNVLRLLDATGISVDRAAGAPVDAPLGPGTFSAPVVSGEIVAVLELTTSRLFTFTAGGLKVAEVQLAPGSDASSLVRGEDGRLYVDEPGGAQTRVVRPDGTVGTVALGGDGPGAAGPPAASQLEQVTPPPAGRVTVPVPDDRALPTPNGTDVTVAGPQQPGTDGPDTQTPGDPVEQAPPAVVPPVVVPNPPPDDEPEPVTPPVAAPGTPAGVTAQLVGEDGVRVTWRAGGGGAATGYTVTGSNGAGNQTPDGTTAQFTDLAPGTYTFTVVARNEAGTSAGAQSGAVTVEAAGPAAPTGLTAQRGVNSNPQSYVRVEWQGVPGAVSYEVAADGVVYSGTQTVTATQFMDTERDGRYQTNYCGAADYQIRAVGADGTRSDPATVSIGAPSAQSDCTGDATVESATANTDGSVTVRVQCFLGQRGPQAESPIVLLANGQTIDNGSQTCDKNMTGVSNHTYRLTGLDAGTTYALQARVSSISGSATSAPVSVTTP